MNKKKFIVVIRAGTMGNGIAHTFAQTGFKSQFGRCFRGSFAKNMY